MASLDNMIPSENSDMSWHQASSNTLQGEQTAHADNSNSSQRPWSQNVNTISEYFTEQNIEMIEENTRTQYKNKLWHKLRYGRVTALKTYEVSKCHTVDGSLIAMIMGVKIPDKKAMRRGRDLESQVKVIVEKTLGEKVTKRYCIIVTPTQASDSTTSVQPNRTTIARDAPTLAQSNSQTKRPTRARDGPTLVQPNIQITRPTRARDGSTLKDIISSDGETRQVLSEIRNELKIRNIQNNIKNRRLHRESAGCHMRLRHESVVFRRLSGAVVWCDCVRDVALVSRKISQETEQ
ncbi:unnamed protein product [Diatraea saccharalis]|uniref:Uncharacterized protein n=1 Tax=Diatraea saccharalis TaxID=40085 RepID=A0A9N9R4W4_9NEOP|nr:unnamed protein product [Diatraea saccharalis]